MSIELDAVEERIQRLEKYVVGENSDRQDDEQVKKLNRVHRTLLSTFINSS